MRGLRQILLLTLVFCVINVFGGAPTWEHLGTNRSGYDTEEVEKVEVNVQNGYIYIYAPKSITVKVMSIVGQMISQQTIPAGVSRLKVSAKGIYILKAGTLTMRVSV